MARTFKLEVDIWNRKNVTYTKYIEVWCETIKEDPTLIAAQLAAATCPEDFMVVEVRIVV